MTEVTNPKRILSISLENDQAQLSRVIKDLTGSAPQQPLAGASHSLSLKTRYYKADVPIWLDLIASPEEWSQSFLTEEASEVLSVLGGVVLVFAVPGEKDARGTKDLITHVGNVVQRGLGGWEWDGVRLAVGVGAGDADEWDELCAEAGMEFVQLDGGDTLQDFGGTTGIARVKEALEANDWEQGDLDLSDEDEADKESSTAAEDLDFGIDKKDMEELRRAIFGYTETEADKTEEAEHKKDEAGVVKDNVGEVDDDDVAKVEAMMRKLQAAREAGEGMSEAQRKKMAAKAVAEVMKDF